MKCPKCGSDAANGSKSCPKCGYRFNFGGNTEFYKKAAASTLRLGDIFSDVFKHHDKTDGERMFMAGTSLTTPSEDRMLAEWRKPWLFAWIVGVGLAFILLMRFMTSIGAGIYALIPIVFVGAIIIPLGVLLFFWEMNIPRNIPIYSIILMFLIGGTISLIITLFMNNIIGDGPSYLAPLSEEPAKLLALCLFLRKSKNKYGLNGLLIGAAIGTGFAAIETMGYALGSDDIIGTLVMRGVLSPGGHVAWAAMYGGMLALVKGSESLQAKHFTDSRFIAYFGLACLLHFTWNYPLSIVPLPVVLDLKYVILVAAAWIALLNVIKKGVQQILSISEIHDIRNNKFYPAIASALKGISGIYKDCTFPLTNGNLVIGRDSKRTNIVFMPSTPGISSVHCEIRKDGEKVLLIDKGSSYGTFLANGTKLAPNQPYTLGVGDKFYLANHNNQFEIT